MHRILAIIALALFASVATAAQWEYRVVYLQTLPDTVAQDERGIYIDRHKTDLLNQLAADGWDVITVTGASAADHAVYLRRPRNP